MKIKELRPVFVDHLPESLEEGVLYISEEFAIAGHKCCCGCGEEVITPLNNAQWHIQKKGGKVNLYPSIGNWKFACKSHYWIRKNRVIGSFKMNEREIGEIKIRDRVDKDEFIRRHNEYVSQDPCLRANTNQANFVSSLVSRIKKWLSGR